MLHIQPGTIFLFFFSFLENYYYHFFIVILISVGGGAGKTRRQRGNAGVQLGSPSQPAPRQSCPGLGEGLRCFTHPKILSGAPGKRSPALSGALLARPAPAEGRGRQRPRPRPPPSALGEAAQKKISPGQKVDGMWQREGNPGVCPPRTSLPPPPPPTSLPLPRALGCWGGGGHSWRGERSSAQLRGSLRANILQVPTPAQEGWGAEGALPGFFSSPYTECFCTSVSSRAWARAGGLCPGVPVGCWARRNGRSLPPQPPRPPLFGASLPPVPPCPRCGARCGARGVLRGGRARTPACSWRKGKGFYYFKG